MTKLKNLIVFSRNIENAASFYSSILGMKILNSSRTQIELRMGPNMKMFIKSTDSEALCSAGYSPLLTFSVDDMDFIMAKLKDYGCRVDGEAIEDENRRVT
jgi:catechol-2,3-dioxygenase